MHKVLSWMPSTSPRMLWACGLPTWIQIFFNLMCQNVLGEGNTGYLDHVVCLPCALRNKLIFLLHLSVWLNQTCPPTLAVGMFIGILCDFLISGPHRWGPGTAPDSDSLQYSFENGLCWELCEDAPEALCPFSSMCQKSSAFRERSAGPFSFLSVLRRLCESL